MKGREKIVEHQTEPGGVQQCRTFPHDAADGQNAAGDDAVDGVGQHHGTDHAPLSGSQPQCSLPVGLGHGFQALLGSAENGGQDHHHQSQSARQHTCLQIHFLHEKQHADKAEDNGWDSRQGLGSELNEAHQPPVFRILRQIDGSPHAQGQNDDHGHQNDIQSVENIW